MTRTERAVLWVAGHIPQPILAAPERVLINVACVLIGATALVAERPGSLLELWPAGFPETWALTIALGGTAALVGHFAGDRAARHTWATPVERLGYLLILIASVVYGVGVFVEFGWQGAFSGLFYLMVAFAKAARLLVTSAYRSYLLRDRAAGDAS